MPAGEGKLVADVTGEVEETDDGVIVLRRVHVKYTLRADTDILADAAKRQAIDRVHGFHARKCPVARSIGSAVDITTDLELVPYEGDNP
ncbi:MAG TPA: hypothetical protein VEM93_06130 [Actinomycetota bacterium]|nr:hypothetical protein [Actinomycetota bacterium]